MVKQGRERERELGVGLALARLLRDGGFEIVEGVFLAGPLAGAVVNFHFKRHFENQLLMMIVACVENWRAGEKLVHLQTRVLIESPRDGQ